MIFLGVIGKMSMGKLFMAGVMPGLLMVFLFVLCIGLKGLIQPKSCPSISEKYTLVQKIVTSRAIVMPGLIILAVLGTIFFGIATPTEASAVGAFACIIATAVQRRLNWRLIKETSFEAFRINSLAMWVAYGAIVFSAFYARAGGITFMGDLILGLGLGRWGTLILIEVIIFLMGCFLDTFAIILLIAPITLPLIKSLGFDPIWFGILFVINSQTGFLTPPFGYNLFYLRAVCPPDITMGDIYRSTIPSISVMLIAMALVMIFPQIALWFPSLMVRPGG